jgi:hypothetical protein
MVRLSRPGDNKFEIAAGSGDPSGLQLIAEARLIPNHDATCLRHVVPAGLFHVAPVRAGFQIHDQRHGEFVNLFHRLADQWA